MEALNLIDGKGFPKSVRVAVNKLIVLANRPWLVQFEDVPSASFLDSDENVVLVLPRSIGAGGGSLAGGFKCTSFSATLIRVFFGTLKAQSFTYVPTGMHPGDSPVFTVARVGSAGFVMLEVAVKNNGDTHDGEVDTVQIICFSDIPDDTETKFYQPLGSYSADGNVTPGGEGNGIGDQAFNLCGGLGGYGEFWRA